MVSAESLYEDPNQGGQDKTAAQIWIHHFKACTMMQPHEAICQHCQLKNECVNLFKCYIQVHRKLNIHTAWI